MRYQRIDSSSMGVIRPPWITKEWFAKCPFNYCDHFGNQEVLATICKICKDDAQRKRLYKKAGKDPYDSKYVFQDLAESLAKVHIMLEKDAKRLGIDLQNLPDEKERAPKPETYSIFRIIQKYSKQIEKIIDILQKISLFVDSILIIRAIEALSHSCAFIIVKTARAIESRHEENQDSTLEELADSKTSAFFVYIAIERNSRAFFALSQLRLSKDFREIFLELSAISIEIAQLIQKIFFPDEKLVYEEFGCEEYDESFEKYINR